MIYLKEKRQEFLRFPEILLNQQFQEYGDPELKELVRLHSARHAQGRHAQHITMEEQLKLMEYMEEHPQELYIIQKYTELEGEERE